MAESNGYKKMTKDRFQELCDVEFRNYFMDPTLNPILKLEKEINEQRQLLDKKHKELSNYEHNFRVMKGYQDDFEYNFMNRPKPTTRTVGVYVNITSAEERAQQAAIEAKQNQLKRPIASQAAGKPVKSDPLNQLSQMVPHKASSKDGTVDFVDLTDDIDKVRPKQAKLPETITKASTTSSAEVKPKCSQLVSSKVDMQSSQSVVRQLNFAPVPTVPTIPQNVQAGSPPVRCTAAGPSTTSLIGLPKTAAPSGKVHEKQNTFVVPSSSSQNTFAVPSSSSQNTFVVPSSSSLSFKARAIVPGTKRAPPAKSQANNLPSSRNVFLVPKPPGPTPTGRAALESLPSTRFIQKQLAPLPEAPKYPSKSIIPFDPPSKPTLKISKAAKGIVLSWNLALTLSHDKIKCYQLYGYEDINGPVDSTTWQKVGEMNALPLPMACTLTQFNEGSTCHFAIRAVDVHSRVGPFSDVASITVPPSAN